MIDLWLEQTESRGSTVPPRGGGVDSKLRAVVKP